MLNYHDNICKEKKKINLDNNEIEIRINQPIQQENKILISVSIDKEDKTLEISDIIKLKDKRIKFLEDLCIKKQKRETYSQKNIIYMLTTEDNKKKNIYIIGKAKNLKTRLSTYNKTSEHEVIYYKECKSIEEMNIIETMVLAKLNLYKEKANRDRFILPVENEISFFIYIIKQSIKFFN